MSSDNQLFLGRSDKAVHLDLGLANRHGLIAGATGTGKTVSLQVLAEGFSAAGVPVFMADVKGDLSGISQAGKDHPKLLERAELLEMDKPQWRPFPTVFWDLYGKKGHPIRTTISEMGPLLLSRLLELNDNQEGVLNVVFAVADDNGMLLLDLKDLRAMLNHVAENAREISAQYGGVSRQSISAIQRRLLTLDRSGGKHFFGEPALELNDLIRCDENGYGYINILAGDKLMQDPRLYSTFLLWLLSELFEELPEVGDADRPKLVFFFDEAHLLFDDAPKALLQTVEQVVRLIRSKGVGVYFVSQSPSDIPDDVLGQLGNRVQHALRAFTPKDRKTVKAAAETFRPNPKFDAAKVITELGVGQALVSTLQGRGTPSVVQDTFIRPPLSRLGPAKPAERKAVIAASDVGAKYDQAIDRESAFEILQKRAEETVAEQAPKPTPKRRYKEPEQVTAKRPARRGGRQRQGMMETMAKSVLRSIGSQMGRQIVRGLLGSIFKGK